MPQCLQVFLHEHHPGVTITEMAEDEWLSDDDDDDDDMKEPHHPLVEEPGARSSSVRFCPSNMHL